MTNILLQIVTLLNNFGDKSHNLQKTIHIHKTLHTGTVCTSFGGFGSNAYLLFGARLLLLDFQYCTKRGSQVLLTEDVVPEVASRICWHVFLVQVAPSLFLAELETETLLVKAASL